MNKIYVIDDDEKLNALLSRYLSQYGYAVTSETHPRVALESYKKINPDMIILDVMMPEMDGFELCRAIRFESQLPVIMLTARGEVTDRIVGLEMGADDYLPKPFEPRELLARIQAVLRRREPRFQTDGDTPVTIDERRWSFTCSSICLKTGTRSSHGT
ncbi:MAG: response regulator transcription factor [Spirochaetota bacterium]